MFCLTSVSERLCSLQVSDIAIAVREGADAVMLSGETAFGKFPFKAVEVMGTVAKKTESSMLSYSVSAMFMSRVHVLMCAVSANGVVGVLLQTQCLCEVACPTPDTSLHLLIAVDSALQHCSAMFTSAQQC